MKLPLILASHNFGHVPGSPSLWLKADIGVTIDNNLKVSYWQSEIYPEESVAEFNIPETIMGAVQMLDELSLQYDVIDMDMELDSYKLIILPDDLIVNQAFQQKLNRYVKNGGSVIACSKGGLLKRTCDDNAPYCSYPECFGVEYAGEAEKYPDFIIAEGDLSTGLEQGNEYVIYLQGERVVPAGAQAILNARAPYFNRDKGLVLLTQIYAFRKGRGLSCWI